MACQAGRGDKKKSKRWLAMSASVCVLLALPGGARAQDAAAWARLDALLPAAIRDTLPSWLRLIGELCELPETTTTDPEWFVIEHSAGGSARYPAGHAGERLRGAGAWRGGLAVYAGGWGNRAGDAAARGVVGALLRDHTRVLELDAAALGGPGGGAGGAGYRAAAARVGSMAAAITRLLRAAAAGGARPGDMHLVGFSLGAHAAAAAARRLAASGARVGRLTALDPARPCFTRGAAARWRVGRDAARFVHVIHSSALGFGRALGHADVHVRGAGRGAGRGAAGLDRAHQAAWRAWAGSPLRARRCSSPRQLAAGTCSGETLSVGYGCSETVRGVFSVQVDNSAALMIRAVTRFLSKIN